MKTVLFQFNMCQYSSILQAITNILQYSSILPEQLGDGRPSRCWGRPSPGRVGGAALSSLSEVRVALKASLPCGH